MNHETARALCDAGYMTVAEYVRLVELNGWNDSPSIVPETPAEKDD